MLGVIHECVKCSQLGDRGRTAKGLLIPAVADVVLDVATLNHYIGPESRLIEKAEVGSSTSCPLVSLVSCLESLPLTRQCRARVLVL